MTMTILIVALLVIALLYFVLKGRGARSGKIASASRPATQQLSESDAFHAVSIKYTSGSCEAAKLMHGKRFLSSAAPKLPLPDCDVQQCRCKFQHHKDRRSSEDRRNPFQGPLASSATGVHKIEQRQGRDRRADPPPTP